MLLVRAAGSRARTLECSSSRLRIDGGLRRAAVSLVVFGLACASIFNAITRFYL